MKWFQMAFYTDAAIEGFCKKGAPKNFTKFTRKRLCRSLFFKKGASLSGKLQVCNFTKEETPTQVFFVIFSNLLKNTLLIEHLQWLLPEVVQK